MMNIPSNSSFKTLESKSSLSGIAPRPPKSGAQRGQYRQGRPPLGIQKSPISIVKDIQGVLKVKIVKQRPATLQEGVNISQSSGASQMSHMKEPRLSCSFNDYDKNVKCNNTDSQMFEGIDSWDRPFCEECFDIPIRGLQQMGEYITIKLHDKKTEIGKLRLRVQDLINGEKHTINVNDL